MKLAWELIFQAGTEHTAHTLLIIIIASMHFIIIWWALLLPQAKLLIIISDSSGYIIIINIKMKATMIDNTEISKKLLETVIKKWYNW